MYHAEPYMHAESEGESEGECIHEVDCEGNGVVIQARFM